MLHKAYIVEEVIKIPQLYSFFWRHYDSSYVFEGEIHNFWECVLVRQGEICVTADEHVYHLHENEMIFHKPLELHKFNIESSEGAELMIFSYALEGEATSWLKNKVFSLSIPQRNVAEEMIEYAKNLMSTQYNSKDYERTLHIIGNNPQHLQMLSCGIIQLFLMLMEKGNIASSYTGYEEMLFKTAVDYMNDNLSKNVTLEELSKECHVSLSSLKRIFKRFAGMGTHRYFMTLKIKAATLLLQSGVSVTETAAKLGFSSQSYFSATYKRETGNNPSQSVTSRFE